MLLFKCRISYILKSRLPNSVIIVITLLFPCFLQANDRNEVVDVFQTDKQIVIDGNLDDEAWGEITPLKFYQHTPLNGKDEVTHSVVKAAYDQKYFYLSARCTNDKDKRSTPTFKRDALGRNMDHVGLILDTYNDNENALMFFVTPTGSRIDATMINDAANGEMSTTWDGFWDAEVEEDESGWSMELRIPFSSLKFQSINNESVMGMTVYSYIAKDSKMDTYPDISNKWGFWSWSKPSQTQKIRFKNIEPNRPLYIAPYLLAGFEQSIDVDEKHKTFSKTNLGEFEAGLDMKYALSDNLTVDLTVNTDFAQVEADDAQINLTRFSLFFPEKRKFFLERESNFNFNFGGYDNLFYSRSIGLFEDKKVRIIGGARLVGRVGKWDVGLMNLQTGRSHGLPTENFGVYRLRRQVINSYSYMGGIITNRFGETGDYNLAYGLDGIVKVVGDEYFSYNLAQTVNKQDSTMLSGFDASRVSLSWERRKYEGISYKIDYDYSGAKYTPGIGFQLRNDFSGVGARLAHGWIPGDEAKIQRFDISLTATGYMRNKDNTIESIELTPYFNVAQKNTVDYGAGLPIYFETLTDTFHLSDDTYITEGTYKFVNASMYFNTAQDNKVIAYFNLHAGGFYDGNRISADVYAEWNASRYLQLSGFYQYNQILFNQRSQEFYAQIARFKIQITLNTKIEAASYIQYNSAAKQSIINFRLRYNPKDGNDLYVVYNEGRDLQRRDYDFTTPIASDRALLMKYVYTFRL